MVKIVREDGRADARQVVEQTQGRWQSRCKADGRTDAGQMVEQMQGR